MKTIKIREIVTPIATKKTLIYKQFQVTLLVVQILLPIVITTFASNASAITMATGSNLAIISQQNRQFKKSWLFNSTNKYFMNGNNITYSGRDKYSATSIFYRETLALKLGLTKNSYFSVNFMARPRSIGIRFILQR